MAKDGKGGAGGGKRGGGKAGGKAAGHGAKPVRGALHRHEQRVRSGEAAGEAGVPRAVERRPDQGAPGAAAPSDARIAWMLDLLAYAGHGRVAAHVDLRASRASMPPVVLADGKDAIIALDDAAALARLASRHRAFSQIAARFAPLVLAARDQGRPLHIELWDLGALLDGQAAVARLGDTAVALGRYLGAEVQVPDLPALQARLASLRGPDAAALPAKLRERNALAWLLAPLPMSAAVSSDVALAQLSVAAADAAARGDAASDAP